MTESERVGAALGRLPIFPLPRTVLLPRAVMPLHVFEPRYRLMIADALGGDRVLAIATLQPGWEADYEGRPAVHAVACAGIILQDEKLPDGRYNLLLLGVQRVRILGEHPPKEPYRTVRAEAIVDAGGAILAQLDDQADALRQMVLQLCTLKPGQAANALAHVAAHAKGASDLADAVAAALLSEPDARLALLSQPGVDRRLDYVSAHVASLLGAVKPPAGKLPLLN